MDDSLQASTSCKGVGDSSATKRQRFDHDSLSLDTDEVIQIEEDNDSESHLVVGGGHIDQKNKQIMDDRDWQKPAVSFIDLTGSNGNDSPEYAAISNSSGFFKSDLSSFDDYAEDEASDLYEDNEDYDFGFDSVLPTNDFSQFMDSMFDDLDLHPGVEATVPWLQDSSPKRPSDLILKGVRDESKTVVEPFKKFDTVQDSSDHHFELSNAQQTSKNWGKRIQHEWKLLENDLPDSIYVRAYEDRMDLLRAAIVGPAGTPYHDGLFFFDIQFPLDYPHVPPKVHHHSGGLRLNPNLYACGKVCLSLLNTWSGRGCEKWSAPNSTMLQVLVSIQALVLNEKPYFNEPGYASHANTRSGESASICYNQNAFLLSCRRMLYSLRNPPKHFEDLVICHFREHGPFILESCKAYMSGAPIGSALTEGNQETNAACSKKFGDFKTSLEKLYEELLMDFMVKGADCIKFLREKVTHGSTSAGKESDTAVVAGLPT